MESQTKKIRAFIAIELGREAKEELLRIQSSLKESKSDVKWTSLETLHLTLKFLGSTPEDKVPSISERLEKIARESKLFEFSLSEIGVFPDWKRPRVIWVGLGSGSKEIVDLAKRVEEAMKKEGFEAEEREFSPHLTLARVKSSKDLANLQKIAENLIIEPILTKVTEIVLFKSDLTKEGALHTPLYTAKMLV